ncbi:MAG: hypothetical protein ABI645_17000 [Pseudomonadota bacterium]
MRSSLILDFDGSATGLAGARIIALRHREEAIRFACALQQLAALGTALERPLQDNHGVVLLGSGDFHHVTLPLIARASRDQPIEVVVLDNHPDNMRWIGGIHCGSWVRHVAALPNVTHVHVLGITSADISTRKLWENYLSPLWRGRLTYWSVGRPSHWLHRLARRSAFKDFASPDALCTAFARMQAGGPTPVYFSVDKDVLRPDVVVCNWDQGQFEERHVEQILEALKGRIVAADITGELSPYEYKVYWKRWLSARDAQPRVEAATLAHEQKRHLLVNTRLVAKIHRAMRATDVPD